MRAPQSRRNVHRLRCWLLVLLLALAVLLGALFIPIWHNLQIPDPPAPTQASTGGWHLPSLPDNDRHVLLLMIDGLPAEAYEAAFAAGRMPHLEQLVADRPTSSTTAIASFPSSTSPSVPELLSGRYVDTDDLPEPPAVHAFDRRERTVVRYVTEPDAWQWPVPTLFDAVRGRPAITVFEGRWDGPISILTQYNMMGQALLEAVGAAAFSGGDRKPVQAYLERVRNGMAPVVSLVVLNEVDMTGHFHGPDSPEVQRALERADELIGQIVATLAATPATRPTAAATALETPGDNGTPSLLDRTTLVLFGDHGMAPSGRYIDLADFLSSRGLSAVDVATISHVLFRERLGPLWTNWTDVILVAGGSNITQVYLRDPDHGWAGPAGDGTPAAGTERKRALAAELTGLTGIDQIMWLESDGAVHVLGAGAAEARILTSGLGRERRFAYLGGDPDRPDPFHYRENPRTRALLCGASPAPDCFHTTTEWLDASAGTAYPGAVPLLPEAFKSAKFSGDLMVAARRGYTFMRGQNGDHGNLDRAAMLTPLVINGPGVAPATETHHPRLVDIYPSVAVLLGARVDDPALTDLDGRVLDGVARQTGWNSAGAPGSDWPSPP